MTEFLQPVGFRYDPKPSIRYRNIANLIKIELRIQKIQNLAIAIKFVRDQMHVQVDASAENFVDEDKKMILGCLWSMFRKHRIETITIGLLDYDHAILTSFNE